MSPPLFNDLGKSAKDLFNKGYNFDTFKLDVKTKIPNGCEFSSGGVSYFDSGKVVGNLESKYKFKEYGLNLSEKWSTSNILVTEVSLQDLFKGAKFSAESSFAPQTGDKSLKIKTEYKHDVLALNSEADFKTATPVINLAGVLGYHGWLTGVQLMFDCKDSKLKSNNLALGYSNNDFVLHTSVIDGKQFNGYMYRKVDENLEAGVELAWTSESSNQSKLGVGCKYTLDSFTSVRAKVNNSNQIGLGFSQKIKDGITFTLSTLIEGKTFNQGGHKVGMSLEFDL